MAVFEDIYLSVVPIRTLVAFANDEIHSVGKINGKLLPQPPYAVVITVAEFLGGAIRRADLPNLLAVTKGMPMGPPSYVPDPKSACTGLSAPID